MPSTLPKFASFVELWNEAKGDGWIIEGKKALLNLDMIIPLQQYTLLVITLSPCLLIFHPLVQQRRKKSIRVQ
jgi:hypothetical protein